MARSLYFWKVEKSTGYCKIFRREKNNGVWSNIYVRSLGLAEKHHKFLQDVEDTLARKAKLVDSLVTGENKE